MRFKSYINEQKVRKSVFDPTVSVVILYKDDPDYENWINDFKRYGIAIGVPDKKTIVWNGEELKKLSNDEILFVEAHEFSHFKLGPTASESDCDYLAIKNLWDRGKRKAAKIGIDNFKSRHGMELGTGGLRGYK